MGSMSLLSGGSAVLEFTPHRGLSHPDLVTLKCVAKMYLFSKTFKLNVF